MKLISEPHLSGIFGSMIAASFILQKSQNYEYEKYEIDLWMPFLANISSQLDKLILVIQVQKSFRFQHSVML